MKTARSYLQLFLHNTLASQTTNRQTDRQHLMTIAKLCNAVAGSAKSEWVNETITCIQCFSITSTVKVLVDIENGAVTSNVWQFFENFINKHDKWSAIECWHWPLLLFWLWMKSKTCLFAHSHVAYQFRSAFSKYNWTNVRDFFIEFSFNSHSLAMAFCENN